MIGQVDASDGSPFPSSNRGKDVRKSKPVDLETQTHGRDYDWISSDVLEVRSSYTNVEGPSTTAPIVNALEGKWQMERPRVGKRICISYDGCYLPVYDILFREQNMKLPLTNFEIRLLRHLLFVLNQMMRTAVGNDRSCGLLFFTQRTKVCRETSIIHK